MITKNLFLVISVFSLFLVNCNNLQNSTPIKEENQVGIIKGNDFRSKAMMKFTDAYVNNDLNSVSDLFTEEAKIMVNDADLTFSEMAAGLSNGHNYFNNIHFIKSC